MARKTKLAPEDLKEKKQKFEKIAETLEQISADKFLKTNFLPYAWSYNLDRALVDVSGLKPVQRRTLYSMFKDNLTPTSHRSVVATLAGRVLAYHPHGNTSVEDALKNMGRDHSFRVPLIDGEGDFGEPGSPGAASRYIKARLSKAAWLNVEELNENAVRMIENYDGTKEEPVRLPVKWPVAVVNGGSGIAIAYSSNMPSHNPTEIMEACKALLKNPEMTHDDISKIIKGPDFNMGGVITSNDGIKNYLEKGTGTFKIRGNYEVTEKGRGSFRIEFYEIPFGTYPEKIIEDIQKASEKGHFKEITSYKDLSDLKHPIRIVIDTKPSVNYKKVLQDLFRYTSLESSMSANMTTIVDNRPQLSSMKELLLDFIKFRKDCVVNKSQFNLNKKSSRLHLVEGLILALVDVDKVISIIRNSDDASEASINLQRAFSIDEEQASHILSLQLRRLTKMDSLELQKERENLVSEIEYLNSLIEDSEVLKKHLLKEFEETEKVIGDERKTEIVGMSSDEVQEREKELARELKKIEKDSPCYVNRLFDGSLIRSDNPYLYRNKSESGEIVESKSLDFGPVIERIKTSTQSKIVVITSDGIAHRIPVGFVSESSPSDKNKLGIKSEAEVVGIAKDSTMKSEIGIGIATKNGTVKISKTDFPNKDEFPVISLDDGDDVVSAVWIRKSLNGKHFAMVSKEGNILLFDASSIRVSGSRSGGVRGMKLRGDDDEVVFFNLVDTKDENSHGILSATESTVKLTSILDIPVKGKGGMGVALHSFRAGEDPHILKAFAGENAVITMGGMPNIVNLPPYSKRSAKGVDLPMRVDIGSKAIDLM